MAMISIIIPIYNAEKTLKKCLESIVKQSYKDIELILVNDGSIDSSLEICNRFSKRDSRIKVINKENEGSVKARIDGINKSTGKYITFVDSDDWLDRNALEVLIMELDRENIDILCFNSYKVLGNYGVIKVEGNRTYFKDNKIYKNKEIEVRLIAAWLHGHPFPSTLWGKIYKREVIQDAFKYSKYIRFFYDDLMTNFEVFFRAKTIKLIDIPLYYYRYGVGTSKYMPYLIEDVINVYRVQKIIIEKYYSDTKEDKYNGISIMLLNTLKTCILNLFYGSLSKVEKKRCINYFISYGEVIESCSNEGSLKYFSTDFINSIINKDSNYLYQLGESIYKKTNIKRLVLNTINKVL